MYFCRVPCSPDVSHSSIKTPKSWYFSARDAACDLWPWWTEHSNKTVSILITKIIIKIIIVVVVIIIIIITFIITIIITIITIIIVIIIIIIISIIIIIIIITSRKPGEQHQNIT